MSEIIQAKKLKDISREKLHKFITNNLYDEDALFNIFASDTFSKDLKLEIKHFQKLLQTAYKHNDTSEIKYFLENGGNIDINVFKSQNMLIKSCLEDKNPEFVSFLIDNGADINGLNSDEGNYAGISPLGACSLKGNNDLIYVLLSNGANIDLRQGEGPYFGMTAIGLATFSKNVDTTILLIKYGADVNKGSPLLLAVANNDIPIVELLLTNKNVKVDIIPAGGSYKGLTALFLASKLGYEEIVKLLLSRGAKPNFKIENGVYAGLSAKDIASTNGHTNIKNLL